MEGKEWLNREAIDFYKKALIRYINKGLFSNIKELWHKLIQLSPEDYDFLSMHRKNCKAGFAEKLHNFNGFIWIGIRRMKMGYRIEHSRLSNMTSAILPYAKNSSSATQISTLTFNVR